MTMKSGGEARPMVNIQVQKQTNMLERKTYPIRQLPFRANFSGRANYLEAEKR